METTKVNENQQLQATPEKVDAKIIQSLVLDGDIGKMNPQQKVEYYNHFCQSLGLNPLTQPFQIIKFQGKEKLYATKDCTEQLRKIYGVSITEITSQELRGIFIVTAKAIDKTGKADAATGAVTIEGLKGEALANALMKAETKAKRRVTLSICGLGILDESETDTMPPHEIKAISTETKPISLNENQTTADIKPPYSNGKITPNQEIKAEGSELPWLSEEDFKAAKYKIEQGDVNEFPKIQKTHRMKKTYREELQQLHEFSLKVQPTTTIEVSHEIVLQIETCQDIVCLEKIYKENKNLHSLKSFNELVTKKKKSLLLPTK